MYVILLIITVLMKEVLPLRIQQFSVPTYRMWGQTAQLECDYELGSDTLYSVKWYRDNKEFYRYTQYEPPSLAFKLEGIKVDLQNSDSRKITLHQLTLKSTGLYRCEVSADAPSFTVVARERRMEIIYLPTEQPKITEIKQESQNYGSLFLNCSSGRSYPAAILSWDVDGEKITDPDLLVEYPPTQHTNGLLSAALGLKVPLRKTMQVKCTAKVAPAWQEGNKAVVGNSMITDSKETMLLVRSSAEASSLSSPV